MMDKNKKRRLESKGYKVGSIGEFFGLSEEESAYIEMKLALRRALAQSRKQRRLTQLQLAKKLNSSQSRVAKMERGDPLVSSLAALGTKTNRMPFVPYKKTLFLS